MKGAPLVKTRVKVCVLIFFIVSVFFIGRTEAGGISTPFGKVVIENLEIGKTYSTSKLSNLFLTVKNNSEATIGLEMRVLEPLPEKKLPEGCEPIPDTSWIGLEKYSFQIEPGDEAGTDVFITIPENEAYRGKRYVVYILSRTTEGMIRLALESTLILGISGSEHQPSLSTGGLEPDGIDD